MTTPRVPCDIFESEVSIRNQVSVGCVKDLNSSDMQARRQLWYPSGGAEILLLAIS